MAAGAGRADLLEHLLDALQRAGSQRQPKAARRALSKAVRGGAWRAAVWGQQSARNG